MNGCDVIARLRWAALSLLALGCSASEPASPSSDTSAPSSETTVTADSTAVLDKATGPEAAARVETGDPSAKPSASIDVGRLADATPRMLLTEPPAGNAGVLTSMAKQYRACWKAELERPNGMASGRGKINVTLRPDGTLAGVTVTGFEKSKAFTSCITDAVKAGKFMPPSAGEAPISFGLELAQQD